MPDKEVSIEEMKLRVPGLNKMEAEEIGKEVMRQVAESIPPSFQNKRLDAVDIKVNISQGASRNEMTKLIAEAILKGLV